MKNNEKPDILSRIRNMKFRKELTALLAFFVMISTSYAMIHPGEALNNNVARSFMFFNEEEGTETENQGELINAGDLLDKEREAEAVYTEAPAAEENTDSQEDGSTVSESQTTQPADQNSYPPTSTPAESVTPVFDSTSVPVVSASTEPEVKETSEPTGSPESLVSASPESSENTETADPENSPSASPDATASTDPSASPSTEPTGSPEAKEEELYPAQSFVNWDKNSGEKQPEVVVYVEAPAGAFPKDTKMEVTIIEAPHEIEEIKDQVAETVDKNTEVKYIQAVDITFKTADGTEIEPLMPIKVSMKSDLIKKVAEEENTKTDLIHIKEDKEKELKEAEKVEHTGADSDKTDEDEITFESASFSVYVIVGTELYTEITLPGSSDTYVVTVTAPAEAKIPQGSTLRVEPFAEGSEKYEYARNAVLADKKEKGEFVDIDTFRVAALDISIIDPDGNEIEPEAAVQVDIKIKELPGVETLEEIKDSLEIQHHVEVADGVVIETVFNGNDEGSFEMATDEDVVKGGTVVDPSSVSDEDFMIVDSLQDSFDVSFTTEDFSTFTITWGSGYSRRTTTIHYGYLNGNTFVEFEEQPSPVNVTTNYRTYLKYDFDGYEYSGYTYYRTTESNTPASGGTRIAAQLRYNSSSWRYHNYMTSNSNSNWNEAANNSHIYVIYNQKKAPETGGTPVIDDATSSDWPQDPSTPQFYKSSTNNTDGTNTVSLSITGGEKEYTKQTKANVIVVFDVSGSMDNDLNGQSRLTRAKTAVNNMANTLLNGSIKGVKMALITFSTTSSATPVQEFTDDYNTYRRAVNGLDADGGTNWEQALYNANRLDVDDDAATFVVFVTDGDPTYRLSRYNAPDSELQGYNREDNYFAYNVYGAGNSDPNNRAFNAAADEVKSILANNKTFYAIGVSSDVTKVQNLVNTAGGGTAYLATDSTALDNAFRNITQSIKTTLGFGDVEVTDGITELANVEMKVMQEVDPDSFTYYKVTSSGRTEWNPTSEGAGLASYNSTTGAVTWDMGESFQLEDGVTYEVTFRVWPSQEAYDLIADLNNGVKVYEPGHNNSITDDEHKQVVQLAAPTATTQGNYTLKTNTDSVSATYSQTSSTGETVTVSGDTDLTATYHEGTIENMPLTSQLVKIKKIFDQSLDPRTVDSVILKLQRKVNDNDHTMVDYNVPGTASPYIELGNDNDWEISFYAAPGFIVDGETLEKGYQFTVTEPIIGEGGEHNVRYDLIPEIVNPMVVDGHLQLIGDGDGNQALTAINRTRSAVEIHKTLYDVDGTTQIYPDTKFTITGELLGPDGTPFTSQEVAAPVAYYLYDKDGNATTGRLHFADSSDISFTLKAGEFIRFVNVPEGCTFEFSETAIPDNYVLQSLAALGRQRAEDDPAYTYSIELDDTVAHLVEGETTISTTDEGIIGNTNYKLDFYNRRVIPLPDVELVKVDQDDSTKKLNGASFELHKDTVDGAVVTTDGNGNTIDITTGNKEGSTGPDGWYHIGLLPAGTYYLIETDEPTGYVLDETPVIITVTKGTSSYSVTATKNGTNVLSGPTEGIYTITVDNVRATKYVKVFKYETGTNPEKALEGAQFSLTGPEGTGISYTGLTTNADGYLVYNNSTLLELPVNDSNYTLTETKAPDGYNMMTENVVFTVTSGGVTGTGSGYTVVSGTETVGGADVTVYTIKVQNSAGVELPHTGGPGTLPYTLGGITVMLTALMYGFRMRRRERRLN